MVSTDGKYDETFLANYLDINVIPEIKRIEGVGDATLLGDTYSMRIWLNPERMAQYGLIPDDVTAVLGEQNIEAPAGNLGENSPNVFQYALKYKGRLKSVEQFEDIVIRSNEDGSVLRLKDIAKVELGRLSYTYHGEVNDRPGVTFLTFQVAGANATEVNEAITKRLEEMSEALPPGVEFVQMMSSNDFLYASIHNVVETLVIASCGNTCNSNHTCYSCGLLLLAGFQEYIDSFYFNHCISYRYVCLSCCSRFQYKHSYFVCACACYRYRGG